MTLPSIIHHYDTPHAPNPRRVRMFLAEKGVSFPTTPIDIMSGAQFEAHKARVGTHHVPAFELADGTYLTETVAMCRYVEALHPEPNLLGEDALEQARVEMWSRRVEFGLMMPIAAVLRHGNPKMAVMEQPQCPEWSAVNRPKVEAALVWLEESLRATPFLAGERFTLADITALCSVEFMRTIRVPVPETHTATLEWHARLKARASYVP
ncbi:MAG: glutathione S-transferase [Pseudomonadota bacterium]